MPVSILTRAAAGRELEYDEIDQNQLNLKAGIDSILDAATDTAISDTATANVMLEIAGVPKKISLDNLVAAISTPASGLAVAAALSDSNIITISQDGGATEVRTTLAALKAYIGAVATAPGAPTGVTATAGNASASVAFTAPASNGGSAITGYTVTSSPAGGTDTNSGTTGLTHSITGLTNGTAYTFTVTATNAIGTSSASSASSAITPSAGATAPAQVTGLTLGTATDTTQPLTWTAPSNGGSAITDYVVQWAVAGSGTWNTFADGTSTTAAATVTGLTASTSYDYRVAAVNSIGTGTNSATSTGSTAAAAPTYTITGYSGNAVKTTADAGAWTAYGSIKAQSGSLFTLNQYWNISPTPASARCGWGSSNSIPPAEITSGQNSNGAASINGMDPMLKPGAFEDTNTLWVPVGSGTTTWYYWIKPVDGVAQCINAGAGLVVSNG